ncbi:MAG: ATP-binding protein, partial [Synergistaceae bacterium]|nr:ATP-binding protein [Synergistaceae bacterium]
GYTEEELLSNFDGRLDAAANALGESKEELVVRIRDYYDGFSFDGTSRLYNPFSTLNFFNDMKFKDYWFESGTPSFIARYMKDRRLTVEEFRGIEVSRNFASAPGEMETATAAGFLYQAGYLSLRPGVADDYSLDYPNHEVLSAMSALLTENILGRGEAEDARRSFRQCLMDGDAAGVVSEFNRLLAAIPYDDYAGAARKTIRNRRFKIDAGEWLYRSTLLSYLYGMGLDVEAELHTGRGRSDMRVKFRGRVWVMELKIARGETETKKAADAAMRQIVETGYADRYENAVLLALAIDDERRAITEYRAEMKPGDDDSLAKASISRRRGEN